MAEGNKIPGIILAACCGIITLFLIIALATPVQKMELTYPGGSSKTEYKYFAAKDGDKDYKAYEMKSTMKKCQKSMIHHFKAGGAFAILSFLVALVGIALGVMDVLGKMPNPMIGVGFAGAMAMMCMITMAITAHTKFLVMTCTKSSLGTSAGSVTIKVSPGPAVAVTVLAWLVAVGCIIGRIVMRRMAGGQTQQQAPPPQMPQAAPGNAAPLV